jgi:subtilisin family serine protease
MTDTQKLDPRLQHLLLKKNRGVISEYAINPKFTGTKYDKKTELTHISVLIELNAKNIPNNFLDLTWSEISDGIYSVDIPLWRMHDLKNSPEVAYVELSHRWRTMLDTSLPATHTSQVQSPTNNLPGLVGEGVIVGIIDRDLDFTLNDFRHANPDETTRVRYLWDQSLTPEAGETSPSSHNFGVEYTDVHINRALKASDPFAVVRHKPGPNSHGTHVASIAAGNGRSGDASSPAGQFIGAAPGSTIIFVHTPAQPYSIDPEDTLSNSEFVMGAVAYIFEKADELDMPCVINLSLGANGAGHDGESLVERAIDRLLQKNGKNGKGRFMVVAAGNEQVLRGHASGTLATGEKQILHWKVGGGWPTENPAGNLPEVYDPTENEIEIWYSSIDRFRVRLRDPSGNETPWFAPGEENLSHLGSGTPVFISSERFHALSGDAHIYMCIGGSAPGVWEVEIEALASAYGHFDAWIEWDENREGNTFANQSFFLGADFDPVRTLVTPATARRALAIANYDHRARAIAKSSSRGRTRDGRDKPELAAPGQKITAAHSLGGRPNPNAPGSVYPMRAQKSGTSMAAPHVAGIVALLLQEEPQLSAVAIKHILIASADRLPSLPIFDIASGYGCVNAARAVELLRDSNT